MEFGRFSDDGEEYIITNPYPPRDWFNMLWNPDYLACVGQSLNGFSLYQNEKGIVTNLFGKQDFRDAPRIIYLRDNESGKTWSTACSSAQPKPDRYRCRHGLGYTILECEKEDIKTAVRIFVPRREAAEIWSVTIKNLSPDIRNISVFTVSEIRLDGVNMTYGYKSAVDGYCDKRKSRLFFRNRAANVMDEKYRGFTYSDPVFDHFDMSRELFLGVAKNFMNPTPVQSGSLNDSQASTEDMVSALQYNLVLAPAEERRINLVTGVVHDESGADRLSALFANSALIDEEFESMVRENRVRLGKTRITTPDGAFDKLFNVWLKHQLFLMADWARFYFKGYRDTLQDAAGMSIVAPQRSLDMLEKALENQRSDGFCPRAFRVPSMDVASADKHYSDSPSWISHATEALLRETGDLSILDRIVAYSDKGEATIWEHNLQAMEFLWKDRGKNGLSLIRHGDWNDLMDKVGARGRGEGIWMSIALARVLLLVGRMAGWKGESETEKLCRARYLEIKACIEKHGWDDDHFIYAITDEGEKVGANSSKEGRVFINPQSWAMLAGIIDADRYKKIMHTVEPLVETPVGPMHHWPPYTEYDPGIGQITCIPAGAFTNGNVYCHAATFKIAADYLAGRSEKAFEDFKRILPSPDKSEPYAQSNGYIGPSSLRKVKHVSDDPWRTGAVAWNILNCFDHLLGFKRDINGVSIDPQIPAEWAAVSCHRVFRGTLFEINVTRGKSKKMVVDGVESDEAFVAVPPGGLKKSRVKVDITLGHVE